MEHCWEMKAFSCLGDWPWLPYPWAMPVCCPPFWPGMGVCPPQQGDPRPEPGDRPQPKPEHSPWWSQCCREEACGDAPCPPPRPWAPQPCRPEPPCPPPGTVKPWQQRFRQSLCLPPCVCLRRVSLGLESIAWQSRGCLELRFRAKIEYHDSRCRRGELERCFSLSLPWAKPCLPRLALLAQPCYRQYGERLELEFTLTQLA